MTLIAISCIPTDGTAISFLCAVIDKNEHHRDEEQHAISPNFILLVF